jgi:hypothetical protein
VSTGIPCNASANDIRLHRWSRVLIVRKWHFTRFHCAAKVGRHRRHRERRSSRAEQARSFGTRTVINLTRHRFSAVAPSAASPDVVNGLDPAGRESPFARRAKAFDLAGAASSALKRTAKACGPGTRCWSQVGGDLSTQPIRRRRRQEEFVSGEYAISVCRGKARFLRGRRSLPARVAPAGSNRSSREGNDHARPHTGSAVVCLTVRRVSVDCTRSTPGSWVSTLVWMRSKSAESR